ncbi:hypothetical protein P7C70_g3115, partial [Phenoliferia sp. Uapishka_3]
MSRQLPSAPQSQSSRASMLSSDSISKMPSSSSIFSARRDGSSSETDLDRHSSSSHCRAHKSPRCGEGRHKSRSPARLSSSSSAMPEGWYERMINLEIENRDLKRRLARQAGSGSSSRSARYGRSPSLSPRKSPKARHDVKPSKKTLPPPEPTQDDLEFPLGVTLSQANEQAAVYWSSLAEDEEVTRSDGFSPELWATMSATPAHLDVTYKYSKLPPYLFTPAGNAMKGFPNPCSDYAALHIVAGKIVDDLFVMGPLPRDQPHLDLMGLMLEHLIPASRNSLAGERKSRAIANQHAPPHYNLPGGLATAMAVKYMSYHKEKHRKARLHRLERAEALMANGQRPPRKSSVKAEKLDPTYEFLRDESDIAFPTSLNDKTAQDENARSRHPHSAAVAHAQQSDDVEDVEDVDAHGSPKAARSPRVALVNTSIRGLNTDDQTRTETQTIERPRSPPKLKPKPRPEVHAHSNGFVDLDEAVQDVMESAKDGGAAVNKSPPKKSKTKKKKTSAKQDKGLGLDGNLTEQEEEPRPPNYSPTDPKNKPAKVTKKTKKQEADAKRMATLKASKAAKVALGLANQSKAAMEAAASSNPEAEGDNGDNLDQATDVEDAAAIAPAPKKFKGKGGAQPCFVPPFKGNQTSNKRGAADAEYSPEPELPPLKRMRTCDSLDVGPVEGARTSRSRPAGSGEPTGEFNDSYWEGIEKSQPLVDAWCKRLGINQVTELAKRHGQGLRQGPARRSYLVDLCAAAQRKQRKQLDPKHDAKARD